MDFKQQSAVVIEDNHTDFLILKHMLLEFGISESNITWSQKLGDFTFRNESFVMCDLNLPDSEGKHTLESVLNKTSGSGSSVIVMTGLSDEQLAQQAIQWGAQDYLIKGTYSAGVLRKTLLFAYERNRLIKRLNQNQQELMAMEQYLSTILSTVPGVIIRFDDQLRIEYLNRPFYGSSDLGDYIGRSILDFVPDFERELAEEQFDLLLRNEGTRMFEGQVITDDAREFNLLYRASPIGDGSYILIATDITELVKSRNELEAQTNTSRATQLQLLSAQMNPHFIFNALSSIQHMILYNQTETSLNFISSFAKLMRQVLENSRKKLIAWEEERNFLIAYLSIEQFRFEGKFEYQFEEADDIDHENVWIPPMLIQPFLENTVVHGLANLTDKKGQVSIAIGQDEARTHITIRDNGVGREKAMAKRKLRIGDGHVSRAMSISAQRIELLNDVYETTGFAVDIRDLTDDTGNALGTEVHIYVPLEVL